MNGRVVDRHSAFLHELFHLTVAQRVGQILSHTRENHVFHKVGPLEADHRRAPPRVILSRREGDSTQRVAKWNLRQNPLWPSTIVGTTARPRGVDCTNSVGIGPGWSVSAPIWPTSAGAHRSRPWPFGPTTAGHPCSAQGSSDDVCSPVQGWRSTTRSGACAGGPALKASTAITGSRARRNSGVTNASRSISCASAFPSAAIIIPWSRAR
jgi:hypothetical protein